MKYALRSLIPVLLACIALSVSSDGHKLFASSEASVFSLSETGSKADARRLMRQVGAKYSSITSYKCKGQSVHQSKFDGNEKTDKPISFEIDYTRGGSSFIRWVQDDEKRLFTTDTGATWLDVNGRRSRNFSTPRDGLTIVSSAKAGWSLFGITYFVFKDEFQVGNKFFRGLTAPFSVEVRSESGHNYYLLTGSFRNVDATDTYWIDQDTNLITKIERRLTLVTNSDGKDYVSVDRTEETYSDIEIK